jgi:hypothetical protein
MSPAQAIATQHGLSVVHAEEVLRALDLTDAQDLAYVTLHPERVVPLERITGSGGWVVWFDAHDTAIAVTNGAAQHGDSLTSLAAAVEWASEVEQ